MTEILGEALAIVLLAAAPIATWEALRRGVRMLRAGPRPTHQGKHRRELVSK